MSNKKIVIVGGGFAGFYAALEFEKSIRSHPGWDVILINRDNFFLFTPMLHEVAANSLDITHIVCSLRRLFKKVEYMQGEVTDVDLHSRKIEVTFSSQARHREVEFDHLILASGSVTNFFGLPGIREKAMTFKTLEDAISLRNRLVGNLEEAEIETDAIRKKRLLTFVIAGGGFAGVETAGAINDYLSYAVNYYPRLKRSDVQVIVVHSHDPILPEYSEDLGRYAQQKLEEKGVRVIVNNRVVACDGNDLVLEDKTRLDAGTLIWTCGVSPSALLARLPCKKVQDRIEANACMQVPDWNNVWAVGDCAYIVDPRNGKPYPQTAQHAFRQGKLLAKNVLSVITGGAVQPFIFDDLGQLATIGDRTAVARILMFKFHGFFAWLLWRCIYLAKLPEFNRKCGVVFDWIADEVFERDIVQFMNAPADVLDGQVQLTSRRPDLASSAKVHADLIK